MHNTCSKFCISLMTALTLMSSCSSNKNSSDTDSAVFHSATSEYHADNDIAMTVASVVDAIKVNQPLDSTEYDFHGVLTDGTGRPLYTDVQGSPGEWEVKVLSHNSAIIRNVYLGDLLPDDLKIYLLESLNIPDKPVLQADRPEIGELDKIAVYDFGQGEIIFETQTGRTESDETGPLLTILIRKEKL